MRCPIFITFFGLLLAASSASAHPLDHLRTTNDIGLNKIPHLGVSHILVIPSRVGVSSFPPGRWAELQAFFDPNGGPGTFRTFWQVASQGRYDPIPTLADPVLYPNSCPLPSKTVSDCTVTLNDIVLLLRKEPAIALGDALIRVRDEQMIDLSLFDVNSDSGPSPDGYFDGVVFDTDIYNGVAFPLAAFGNEVIVEASPGGGGPNLEVGIVAIIPPEHHEFGHLFGFIDLYGGPTVNGLMEDATSTLNPFSRQQVEWAQIVEVDQPMAIDLPPVLDSSIVLRVGQPPQYLLIENRGGSLHSTYETCVPGIYIYSIDEAQLPTTERGFLDVLNGDLYLPNADAPYLDVALPVGCHLGTSSIPNACVLDQGGTERELIHASGSASGFSLLRGPTAADGTVPVYIYPPGMPPDAGTMPTPIDGGFVDTGVVVDGGVEVSDSGAAQPDGSVDVDAGPPRISGDRDDPGGCDCSSGTGTTGGLYLLGLCLVVALRRRRG